MSEPGRESVLQNDILRSSTELQAELIQHLGAQSDLTDLMTKIVDKTADTLHASACTVFTKTASGDRAVQLAGTGYQAQFNGFRDIRVVPPGEVLEEPDEDLKLGLTGWILSTGRPFLAGTPEEVLNHPHHSGKRNGLQVPGEELRLQGFLGVPLYGIHGEVTGVIKAERRQIASTSGQECESVEAFSGEDQLALETVGRVASRCIKYLDMAHNGQVSEAITAWARDVIAESVATEGELDKFLDIVVNVVTAAMRADSCGIFLKDENGNTLTQRAGTGSQAQREVIRAYRWPALRKLQECQDQSSCDPATCARWKAQGGRVSGNGQRVSYEVTTPALQDLQASGVPDRTLAKLYVLKGRGFPDDKTCTAAVEEQIGKEQTAKYGALILEHAETRVGLTAWIAATGKSFHARDFQELSAHCHHRGGFDFWNFPKEERTVCGAFLGIPLRVGGTITGVIKVENISRIGEPDDRDFEDQAQQRFEILSQDIALAIKRLQIQIPARYRVIREAQRTILEILRGGLDIPQLAHKVVTETRSLFNAGACALFLKEGNRLIQPVEWAATGWASLGPRVRDYELVDEQTITETPTPDEKVGLTVWIAVKQRKFTARSNLELKMHPHHKGTYDPYNFQTGQQCESFMGFPLLIKEGDRNRLVGVLKVESKAKQGDPFTGEVTYFNELDELVFELIANSAAIAIQNARLLESRRLADRVREQPTHNDVMDELYEFIQGRVEFLSTLDRAVEEVQTKDEGKARIMQNFAGLLDPSFSVAILEQLAHDTTRTWKGLLSFLARAIRVNSIEDICALQSGQPTLSPLVSPKFGMHESTKVLFHVVLDQIYQQLEIYETDHLRRNALKLCIDLLTEEQKNLEERDLFVRNVLGSVFERLKQVLTERFEMFHQVVNPYVAGMPLYADSPVFVGRDEIFRWIGDNLHNRGQKNVLVLHGGWHTGKTSILYQLLGGEMGKTLRERSQRPIYPVLVDLQGMPDEGAAWFLLSIAETVEVALNARGIPCPHPEEQAFTKAAFRAFDTFLDRISKLLEENKGLLVIMLDEFELLDWYVQQKLIKESIFRYLRSLMQHKPAVTFVLAGRHSLGEMSPEYRNMVFNVALHREVGFLTEEEAKHLIRAPVHPSAVTYEESVIERILEQTGCHPFFVQQVCSNCVDQLNKEKSGYAVTQRHLKLALEEVLRPGNNATLENLWRELNDEGQRVLGAVARLQSEKHGAVTVAGLVDELQIDKASLAKTLQELQTQQLIVGETSAEHECGQYRCVFDLLREWVIRRVMK